MFFLKLPRAVSHFVFWMLYFSIQASIWMQLYDSGENGNDNLENGILNSFLTALKYEWVEAPGKLIAVYANLYILIPKLLLKRKILLYGLATIICIFAASVLQGILVKYIIFPLFFPNLNQINEFINFPKFVQYAAILTSVLVFTASIKILQHFYKEKTNSIELSKNQLDTELNFLKSQINPHFFFNTLNNLYGLALQKSDNTPAMILRLSDMMDYILYQAKVHQIELEKEVAFIENYLELEKLRFGSRINIEFEKTGNFKSKVIPPLLFLPLVENAFKHGASQKLEDSYVKIVLQVNENVYFKVENSKSSVNGFNNKEGLGLENLKRRLELLYPDDFILNIVNDQDRFTAYIQIPLKL